MATMSRYCKAYPEEVLTQYSGWEEEAHLPKEAQSEGADDAAVLAKYLFVHDNFVVTRGVFVDERIVLDSPSAKWREFCHTILSFSSDPEELMSGTAAPER